MYSNSFYNPYMYNNFVNTANSTTNFSKMSGISGLFKKFSFSSFLNSASKTLNVVNQAIPIYYQVKPMINNVKTMFKVMNAVKTQDNSKPYSTHNDTKKVVSSLEGCSSDGRPTFFL